MLTPRTRTLAVAGLGGLLVAGALVAVELTGFGSQRAVQARADSAPSAALLRRLAEAADGYRTGRDVYIVLADAPPHGIVGVFPDSAAAMTAGRAAGTGHTWYGPFMTPQDFDRPMMLLSGCHMQPTRWVFCREEAELPPIPCDSVEQIRVTATVRGRPPITFGFPGCSVDAIFLTLPAVDKFVVPYYSLAVGAEYAADLRRQLEAYIRGERRPEF